MKHEGHYLSWNPYGLPSEFEKHVVRQGRGDQLMLDSGSLQSPLQHLRGTLSHLTGELFRLQVGINMVHIPYKGGPPAVIDLMAGQVSALFAAFPTVFGQVRAGKLRALAISGAKRASAAPDLPTVADTLPGFESSQWWGMFAPAATPTGIVGRLNAEIGKFLGDADVRERFSADGAEPVGGSPLDFTAYLKAEHEKWGKVVKETGIWPE